MSSFDDEDLRAAYAARLREPAPPHGPDCPEPDALLAALNGEGPEADRLRTLDHALACAACRPQLALLHAVSRGAAEARPAAARLAVWRRLAPLAAAASIVVAAGVIGLGQWRQGPGDDVTRAGDAADVTLVAPAAAGAVAAGPATFVWRAVPGALRYTLEVYAADGTVLVGIAAEDTTLATTLAGVPAGEHRWAVRAHMSDGSERRSEARALRVE